MLRSVAAIAMLFVMTPLSVFAHEKPVVGPNGGQLIHLEDAHYELVARDNALTLFVSDNDEKPRQSLVDAKSTATVLADGKTHAIALAPATANTLTGTGTFLARKGLRVIVSIQETGRKPAQIRFTPSD
jgi:hypothetical protein